MVRLLLMQKNAAESSKARLPLRQPVLDPSQDRLAQAFKDNLLGQDGLKEVPFPDRRLESRPVALERGQQGAGPEPSRSQPGDRPLKHDRMQSLLPGLAEEEALGSRSVD